MPSDTGERPEFRRLSTEDLVRARSGPGERAARRLPVTVVLDDVRSASNVGLIFRLCDCLNVSGLWLAGITPFPGVSEKASAKIARTAVGGSLDEVRWKHLGDPLPALRAEAGRGTPIVAVEQGRGTRSWAEVDYPLPLIVVFGHERTGVRDEILDLSDVIVELPVSGVTNSLNVALCASAVLYEIARRAERTGGGRMFPGTRNRRDMSETE